jgi:hypothetical protein
MNDNETAGDTGQQHPYYDSFGSGANSGRMTSTPGLEQEQEQYNSEAPHQYTPQSTLSQIGLSPVAQNASAPSMQSRYNSFTGSVMPNTNTGASESTAETALKLRFAGTDEA